MNINRLERLSLLAARRQEEKKINELIKNSLKDPFDGIGNPEPLKNDFLGYRSRRIDGEHR